MAAPLEADSNAEDAAGVLSPGTESIVPPVFPSDETSLNLNKGNRSTDASSHGTGVLPPWHGNVLSLARSSGEKSPLL
jgi:hypothetical protein